MSAWSDAVTETRSVSGRLRATAFLAYALAGSCASRSACAGRVWPSLGPRSLPCRWWPHPPSPRWSSTGSAGVAWLGPAVLAGGGGPGGGARGCFRPPVAGWRSAAV